MLAVENVQDYPRPPALEPVGQRLRAIFNDLPVADCEASLRVLETHHAPTYYIPPADIVMSALVPTGRETFCEWKGRAVYFDLVVNGRRSPNAAWSYPAPTARFAPLRDHIAFYATALDAAFVGNVKVQPQPGDFYGGWVTPNLTGRVKGAAGTMHW
ncbi:DUF427 domain-containing protein [Hasllibacter sp. MH4015]|uniref:DUF427 domain-containing protein n=1 Tax=Hasllibacter sp. MH4015 TaxID=2854029 RepID=UPI001CD2B12E|nr:DUF427 domain-containing protein [Hasllibacter sp. MH4015]